MNLSLTKKIYQKDKRANWYDMVWRGEFFYATFSLL